MPIRTPLKRSLSLALATMVSAISGSALAAESATSVYLLGSKGSMAGFIPPPGIYLGDLNYYYSGSAAGNAALSTVLRRTGVRDTKGISLSLEAEFGVDADAYYQIPTAIWVAPGDVLGGNLGFSLAAPVGWKDVSVGIDATATFTFPPPLSLTLTRTHSLTLDDDETGVGDPLLSAFLGWHSGNVHWNIGTLVNIPVGEWETGRLANIGFNHWAFDTTGALTWLDPTVGLELSGAVGVTFNTENPDSDYKSGTDFHVEFAAMQHFSPAFAVGVTGYHYEQITGDSGEGAVLGEFKGRVTAIGPALNLTLPVGGVPVATSLKWNHEFNAENRLEGDVGLLTVTIPLGPAPGP